MNTFWPIRVQALGALWRKHVLYTGMCVEFSWPHVTFIVKVWWLSVKNQWRGRLKRNEERERCTVLEGWVVWRAEKNDMKIFHSSWAENEWGNTWRDEQRWEDVRRRRQSKTCLRERACLLNITLNCFMIIVTFRSVSPYKINHESKTNFISWTTNKHFSS